MKLSVVTPVYNGEKHITDNIDSVLNQVYDNFEHIFIDNLSTDSTIDKIKEYNDPRHIIISEKDAGFYDAMNKGVLRAKGSLISILNADDFYEDQYVLKDLASAFKNNHSARFFFSVTIYRKMPNGPVSRAVNPRLIKTFPKLSYMLGGQVQHPGIFMPKDLYSDIGLYDEKMKISADYDLQLRSILSCDEPKVMCIGNDRVCQRIGGISQRGLRSFYVGKKEVFISLVKNKVFAPCIPFIVFLNIVQKIASRLSRFSYNK